MTIIITRIVVTLFALLEMIPIYYLFFDRDANKEIIPGSFQIYTEAVGNVDGMTLRANYRFLCLVGWCE